VEKQLLPDPALRPAYDKAAWLYVYRDFKEDDADLAAERICLRLGMTSYPQHLLIHPETLARLGDTGRSVESFLAAVGKARVEPVKTSDAVDRIVAADLRAVALEKSQSVEAAKKAVDDPDVVVRLRAIAILTAKAPAAVAARAAELLAVPNDPFRYEVCRALAKAADAKTGDPKAARALEEIVKTPKESLNPNVLRCEAVKALGACGDAASVAVVAPHAAGEWRNGLTGISVDALLAIGLRDAKAKAPAKGALAAAFPAPPKEVSERVAVEALAKRVQAALEKLTGKKVPFPATYDEKARKTLAAAW
jgi:hypothetical protein